MIGGEYVLSVYTIPVKLFELNLYTKTFVPTIIYKDFEIEEEWKDIYFKGKNSGYKISNIGRVKNPDGSIAKIYYDKDGYTRFSLYIPKNHPEYNNEKRFAYPYKIHRAVAEAFIVNPNPTEYDIVLHKNDIKDCNFYVNLLWGNTQMNMDDKAISNRSRYLSGEDKPDSIFTEKDVREICECIFNKNMKKKKDIIEFLGKSNRDEVYIKSYKNLIHNIQTKHCWKYIIEEYTNK